MPRYTFDVHAFLTVRLDAPDEQTARSLIDDLDGNEVNLGAWPDGSPVLAGLGLDGEHDLVTPEDEDEQETT